MKDDAIAKAKEMTSAAGPESSEKNDTAERTVKATSDKASTVTDQAVAEASDTNQTTKPETSEAASETDTPGKFSSLMAAAKDKASEVASAAKDTASAICR